MGNTFYFDWEITLMEWLQNTLGESFSVIGGFFTLFGEELILIALLGFLYWGYDKKIGRFVGMNVVATLLLNPMIKNIFVRRRPYFDTDGIKCLKPVDSSADIYDIAAQGYSFPSGHSMNAATIYGSVAYTVRKKPVVILSVIVTLLVAFSRVYLGVHYPTDVLVGMITGTLIVFLVSFLQKRISNIKILYLVFTIIGAAGLFYCTSDDYFTAFGVMTGFFLGDIFETKYVQFENTRNPLRMVLRVLAGGAIYLVLNTMLKLPFSSEFLHSGTILAHLVRVIRYGIILFVVIGIYPMVFRLCDRFFNRKAEA